MAPSRHQAAHSSAHPRDKINGLFLPYFTIASTKLMLFHEHNTNVGLLAACRGHDNASEWFRAKSMSLCVVEGEGSRSVCWREDCYCYTCPTYSQTTTQAPQPCSVHIIILPCCNYRKLINGIFTFLRKITRAKVSI